MGETIKRCARICVFDPTHQYGTGQRQNSLPGFRVFNQPKQLIDFWRVHRRGNFKVIYQPGYDVAAHFDAVARLVLEVRDVVFAVDEIWSVCKAGWLPPPLEYMSRAGRHRGVTLLYTAQRPQIVAADLRDNTNQWRIFRLSGELALGALRGRVPAQALSLVPSLPDRHYVKTNDSMQFEVVKP
jgi:hypothetical protein